MNEHQIEAEPSEIVVFAVKRRERLTALLAAALAEFFPHETLLVTEENIGREDYAVAIKGTGVSLMADMRDSSYGGMKIELAHWIVYQTVIDPGDHDQPGGTDVAEIAEEWTESGAVTKAVTQVLAERVNWWFDRLSDDDADARNEEAVARGMLGG